MNSVSFVGKNRRTGCADLFEGQHNKVENDIFDIWTSYGISMIQDYIGISYVISCLLYGISFGILERSIAGGYCT